MRARIEDPRVAGMVLVNPWIRSDASYAKTQLVHYYGKRLLQREFWKKVLRLDVDLATVLRPSRDMSRTPAGQGDAPTAGSSRIAWPTGSVLSRGPSCCS